MLESTLTACAARRVVTKRAAVARPVALPICFMGFVLLLEGLRGRERRPLSGGGATGREPGRDSEVIAIASGTVRQSKGDGRERADLEPAPPGPGGPASGGRS